MRKNNTKLPAFVILIVTISLFFMGFIFHKKNFNTKHFDLNTSIKTTFLSNHSSTKDNSLDKNITLKKDSTVIDNNWFENAKKNIEREEYNFEYDKNSKTYIAFNRKSNLRFIFKNNRFKTEPGITKKSMIDLNNKLDGCAVKKYHNCQVWQSEIKVKGIGRGGTKKIKRFSENELIVNNNIAYTEDENLKINYANYDSGMKQDFIVKNKSEGAGKLILMLSFNTNEKIKVNESKITILNKKNGKVRYSYSELKICDKNHNVVKGKFIKLKSSKKNFTEIGIEVEDKDTECPILIETQITEPDWTATGEGQFGYSVSTAGDVNGDGYSDVIIGAKMYSISKGKIYVYYGSSIGLPSSPSWTQVGENNGDMFGWPVSTAGDVNGDGFSDIIIGAQGYSNKQGKVYVYYGRSSGLLSEPDWTRTGENLYDYFGCPVSTAGDVNGDGYSDIIIAASQYLSYRGKVYVFHGGPTGLLSSPSWTAIGENTFDYFGISVSTAGDVNGDGYSDVIIGSSHNSSYKGKVYFYEGSSTGLISSASWIATGENTNNEFGTSISTAGDINGDGYSDIIIGAVRYLSYKGKVYVYLGGSSGLPSSPNWTATGENTGDYFGRSVSTVGDINGDGYCDVIIGAPIFSNSKGKVYVFLGGLMGLSSSPIWTQTGEYSDDYYGFSVSIAGDVNGDGFSDIMVGAEGFSSYQGKVYVYNGRTTGLSLSPNWTKQGENTNDEFGYSVSTAGDINGDGYCDVIIGAYYYLGGKGKTYVYTGGPDGLSPLPHWTAIGENTYDLFGYSVSTAGDVNGNGYCEIIIGAPGYQSSLDKGKAYLYCGSSSGLPSSPNWTATGESIGSNFGYSVSTAGDVNGDGYSDVIIGADTYSNSKGKAYVFYGSSTGLSTISNWIYTGEGENNYFGRSVSTAGDINGDGFSDVIVGADGYTWFKGKVYAFYGSSSGLFLSPNWTMTGENVGDYFGSSISSAGDVNGDAYSDVIIGAYYFSSARGKVYVYHGSSSGLTSQNWVTTGENSNYRFGFSVSSAGDVNGDGYSDIIIGSVGYSSFKGMVYCYYGSTTGLMPNANWGAIGENNNDQLGWSVSTAGDINGDGYSDIIIGSQTFASSTGKAYLFYGNAAAGKRTTVKQYKPSTTTIVGPGGLTTLPNQVRLSLYSRSPFGKTKGKLVYEIKNSRTPFSGNPITNSTSYTGISPTWTDLTQSGIQFNYDISGIPENQDYKWRVRIKYNSATNPFQTLGPWKYYKNFLPIPTGGFKPSNVSLKVKKIGSVVPEKFSLYQNYPNPFNPSTKIKFDVPQHTQYPLFRIDKVSLKIYDLLGKEIQTLFNENIQSGSYEVTFDGSNLSSGIYFYKLIMGEFVSVKRMMLIK